MKLLTSIKAWYLRVFLPFELPDHPLHCDHEAAETAKQREEEETEQQTPKGNDVSFDLISVLGLTQ